MNNIDLAKKAWAHLGQANEVRGEAGTSGIRGKSLKHFYDALAEDVVLRFSFPKDTPIYGGEFKGKQAVIDLFTRKEPGIIEETDLETPLEFFANGDRVVLFFEERYKFKETGAEVRDSPVAVVMDFQQGFIRRLIIIEDSWVLNNQLRNRQPS